MTVSSSQIVSAGVTMIVGAITTGTELSSSESLSVATNVATLLNMTSAGSDKAAASKQVTAVMAVVLTGASFKLEVASAVGGAIGQMDSQSGGVVAQQMALVLAAQVLVGQTAKMDLGAAGSMTAASSTGSSLAGLLIVDASGAGVQLPSTLLADMPGLSADATYGAVTLVLQVSPFVTSTSASPVGVVSQQLTVGTTAIAVSGLRSPIVITMPAGTRGQCRYFDESRSIWSADGVTTVVSSTGAMTCHTTHLTSFGGVTSSATSVAVSLMVAVLVGLVHVTMLAS